MLYRLVEPVANGGYRDYSAKRGRSITCVSAKECIKCHLEVVVRVRHPECGILSMGGDVLPITQINAKVVRTSVISRQLFQLPVTYNVEQELTITASRFGVKSCIFSTSLSLIRINI